MAESVTRCEEHGGWLIAARAEHEHYASRDKARAALHYDELYAAEQQAVAPAFDVAELREQDMARRARERQPKQRDAVFTVFAGGVRLLDTLYENEAMNKARRYRGTVMEGAHIVHQFGRRNA